MDVHDYSFLHVVLFVTVLMCLSFSPKKCLVIYIFCLDIFSIKLLAVSTQFER